MKSRKYMTKYRQQSNKTGKTNVQLMKAAEHISYSDRYTGEES
jgi:hypothetical protein